MSGEVIAVGSVVYNMAGDPENRPSYLKTLITQRNLTGSTSSIADTLTTGYLRGPAIKLKLFYNWASVDDNYGLIGIPTGKLEINGTVPADKVAEEIPHPAGTTVEVRSSTVSFGDPRYWADSYMLSNYPALFATGWTWDYFIGSNEIKITFADATSVRFALTSFDYDATYVYAYYGLLTVATGEEAVDRLYIYKIGSGNADLDALVRQKADYGEFFPFIPVRLENKFLSESYHPGAFEQAKAGFKKATGGDLTDLIKDLKDNDDIGDIDHAYVSFGVSLNTKDNSAKKYIYHFFRSLMFAQEGGADAHREYEALMTAYSRRKAAWDAWEKGGKLGVEPRLLRVPMALNNIIRIRGNGDVNTYYDVRLRWSYVEEFSRNGKGRPGAKVGDLWFKAETIIVGYERRTIQVGHGENNYTETPIKSTKLRLYYQQTSSTYTYIDVIGAEYKNSIYKGKAVIIDPRDALNDAEDSGFIVPIHYGTWAGMTMVDRTQMCTACVYAVFNCYEVRKKKWYESGIFQIFLVIVIAIVSVLFTGGAGIGLLGSHLAIGTAMGLVGLPAAILGSVVNALAALVLTTVISKVAEGFGAFGAILSTLLGIVIGSAISSINSGAIAFNWGDLLRVDNLLKLTTAVGNSVTAMIQEDTLGIAQDWADFQENANEQALKIQQAFFKEFGYGAGAIDPLLLVDTSGATAESSEAFLHRTLMTGSEIAQMSQDLLYDFPKYSLDLPDAFT